jgi:hypothetical protein
MNESNIIKVNSGAFFIKPKIDLNLPINNDTLRDLQDKIWHVVKTNNSNISVSNTNQTYLSNFEYEIRKNDIIKLGRIKFLIKDMGIVGGSFNTTNQTFRLYQDCE